MHIYDLHTIRDEAVHDCYKLLQEIQYKVNNSQTTIDDIKVVNNIRRKLEELLSNINKK